MSGTSAWRRHRTARALLGERGAAAVEFALVVPLLLVLLFGIIEFGKTMHAQSTLSAATREGARTMALTNNVSAARTAVQAADGPLDLGAASITVSPTSCTGAGPTQQVTVTISYRQVFASGLVGRTGADLTAKPPLRCAG